MKRQQKVVAKSNSTERFVQGEHLFFYRSMRLSDQVLIQSLRSIIDESLHGFTRGNTVQCLVNR